MYGGHRPHSEGIVPFVSFCRGMIPWSVLRYQTGIPWHFFSHLPSVSSAWREATQMVKNSAWLLLSTLALLQGGRAASGFLKKVRERNVLCESDSLSRMGKINGGKTKTNFPMTFNEILLCALRKMLKMMWSELGELQPRDRLGRRISNFKNEAC